MKYPTPFDAPDIVYVAHNIVAADADGELDNTRDFLVELNGVYLAEAVMRVWQLIESGKTITRADIDSALTFEEN